MQLPYSVIIPAVLMLPYLIGRLNTAPTVLDAFFGYLLSAVMLGVVLQVIYKIKDMFKK